MRKDHKTFSTFHKRNITPVYPFEDNEEPEFELVLQFPSYVTVGKAIRVLYESDKWNKVGNVEGYYHDHGPEDGDGVLLKGNKVKVYAPADYFLRGEFGKARKTLPVRLPPSYVLLGTCGGWFAQPFERYRIQDDEVVVGKTSGAILVCSPYGWVDHKDEERVFLAIIEVDSGVVEAIIAGPGLRVTQYGIEG